jgi:hypothetical protein
LLPELLALTPITKIKKELNKELEEMEVIHQAPTKHVLDQQDN